jgi:hypothetical protein
MCTMSQRCVTKEELHLALSLSALYHPHGSAYFRIDRTYKGMPIIC